MEEFHNAQQVGQVRQFVFISMSILLNVDKSANIKQLQYTNLCDQHTQRDIDTKSWMSFMYTAICLQVYACMFWHTQGRPDSMKWCVQTSRIVELKHQTFRVCIRARCNIDFFLNEYAPDGKSVGDVNQCSKVGTEIEPCLWQIWQFTWGNYT